MCYVLFCNMFYSMFVTPGPGHCYLFLATRCVTEVYTLRCILCLQPVILVLRLRTRCFNQQLYIITVQRPVQIVQDSVCHRGVHTNVHGACNLLHNPLAPPNGAFHRYRVFCSTSTWRQPCPRPGPPSLLALGAGDFPGFGPESRAEPCFRGVGSLSLSTRSPSPISPSDLPSNFSTPLIFLASLSLPVPGLPAACWPRLFDDFTSGTYPGTYTYLTEDLGVNGGFGRSLSLQREPKGARHALLARWPPPAPTSSTCCRWRCRRQRRQRSQRRQRLPPWCSCCHPHRLPPSGPPAAPPLRRLGLGPCAKLCFFTSETCKNGTGAAHYRITSEKNRPSARPGSARAPGRGPGPLRERRGDAPGHRQPGPRPPPQRRENLVGVNLVLAEYHRIQTWLL